MVSINAVGHGVNPFVGFFKCDGLYRCSRLITAFLVGVKIDSDRFCVDIITVQCTAIFVHPELLDGQVGTLVGHIQAVLFLVAIKGDVRLFGQRVAVGIRCFVAHSSLIGCFRGNGSVTLGAHPDKVEHLVRLFVACWGGFLGQTEQILIRDGKITAVAKGNHDDTVRAVYLLGGKRCGIQNFPTALFTVETFQLKDSAVQCSAGVQLIHLVDEQPTLINSGSAINGANVSRVGAGILLPADRYGVF